MVPNIRPVAVPPVTRGAALLLLLLLNCMVLSSLADKAIASLAVAPLFPIKADFFALVFCAVIVSDKTGPRRKGFQTNGSVSALCSGTLGRGGQSSRLCPSAGRGQETAAAAGADTLYGAGRVRNRILITQASPDEQ
ncbi:hypothetical protein WMY93_000973 [Mugilogobius chulae]|uniref:Uncharacterized protein n=1 Tax=Mugilogobius chulae TaxID=88201 RepID=A0AAW0QAV7_9GOBI